MNDTVTDRDAVNDAVCDRVAENVGEADVVAL